MEVGGEGDYIHLSLHCHHQNDFCIKVGSDEMFHNCEGQSHKTVSTDHSFWRERRAEADSNRSPSAYQPNALPLGHTGSRTRTKQGTLYQHYSGDTVADKVKTNGSYAIICVRSVQSRLFRPSVQGKCFMDAYIYIFFVCLLLLLIRDVQNAFYISNNNITLCQ